MSTAPTVASAGSTVDPQPALEGAAAISATGAEGRAPVLRTAAALDQPADEICAAGSPDSSVTVT